MLVACVLSIIACSAIYGLVRVKLPNWLEYGRMNPSSSKKRAVALENNSGYSTLNLHHTAYLDLTEDEDDILENRPNATYTHKTALTTKNPNESLNNSGSSIDKNEKTSEIAAQNTDATHQSVFVDSTDSIQSDEENDMNTFAIPSTSSLARPLFRWDAKPRQPLANPNGTIDLTDDSDSSEKSHRVYSNKRKSKNKRNKSERKGSYFSMFAIENEGTQNEEVVNIKEKILPEVTVQCELTIAGVRVKLPVNPYSSQKAVMAKIIQGCKKQEHALLESPTGSGKTLALLCGALAWQDQLAVELEKERQKNFYDDPLGGKLDIDGECDDFEEKGGGKKSEPVPKIFYGTRTHKQIEQVVRELNKTSYRHKRMTILSSREHTCIRLEDRNKTELCNELLDPAKPGMCEFYNNESNKKFSTLTGVLNSKINGGWDIEDLVQLGRRHSACPYFGARNLMAEADIIFCPYNYLLSPDIRDSMQINLSNQVVILDEAHNIEDTCREAASVDLREDHIMHMVAEFKEASKGDNAPVYEIVIDYCKALTSFLKQVDVSEYDTKTEGACSSYWTGTEAIELFQIYKIGIDKFSSVIAAGNLILQDYQSKKEMMRDGMGEPGALIMSQSVQRNFELLLFALNMLRSKEHVNDYRVCVMESVVKDFKPMLAQEVWYSTNTKKNRARTLKLLSMNPAITFSPLAMSARSIILASGTLSPTTSFQSELGTAFPQTLNANHVIQKDQIYASCIGKGPTGTTLQATYKNINQFTFQDELGRVILDVCETVPHGVLVFFSSYHTMNTQISRWRLNEMWKKMFNYKRIFTEPRNGGDLAEVMRDYRETISSTSTVVEGERNGALLFAVFRGKIAEGIDFSDNEARCVITVGIPYAVAKDPIIKMKMDYNRLNASKGLLNHNEWYKVQAFRALNQALGRCIRHKNDWGAILMVDERLRYPEYNENLPKWIKTSLVNSAQYNLKGALRDFVARQAERDSKNIE